MTTALANFDWDVRGWTYSTWLTLFDCFTNSIVRFCDWVGYNSIWLASLGSRWNHSATRRSTILPPCGSMALSPEILLSGEQRPKNLLRSANALYAPNSSRSTKAGHKFKRHAS